MQQVERHQFTRGTPILLPKTALGLELLRNGARSAARICNAERIADEQCSRLADTLRISLCLSSDQMAAAEANVAKTGTIDPLTQLPDPRLLATLGSEFCLHYGLLPWRRISNETIVLTCRPEQFQTMLPLLESTFGPIRMAVTSENRIHTAIRQFCDDDLVQRAETKVSEDQSCRSWNTQSAAIGTFVFSLGLLASLLYWPAIVGTGIIAFSLFWTVANSLLRAAAVVASSGAEQPVVFPPPLRKPTVTILVPLYHESEIAIRLIDRLLALDYPHELLDVCFLLEQDDRLTREALSRANLPRFMRSIVVPQGALKTKPRALNFGLNFARGSIIGVYDAEDAPDPQQINTVVNEFARSGPDVACLQGALDFYNARTNWLSRCFTIEYATWFRVILPGLERLGLVIPLGGTTLFFRKSVLEHLGGWDAHNVTEDADLGVRIARMGYRTHLIPTTTKEEANCHTWPWIKQRSRWLKGYAITYGVHMRRPRTLLKELGWWRFWGFQVQFLGSLSQFVTAPLLWSFWLLPFGIWHPLSTVLPPAGTIAMSLLLAFSETVMLFSAFQGLRAAGYRSMLGWVPSLHLYFPMASLAAYKGLWELLHSPFYWDKTSHGKFG